MRPHQGSVEGKEKIMKTFKTPTHLCMEKIGSGLSKTGLTLLERDLSVQNCLDGYTHSS